MADAPIDGNTRNGLIAVSSNDNSTIVRLWADPVTHRLLVDLPASSLSIQVPTGAVDDSNRDFVFSSKPNVVVVNGATYRENHGWTWSSGTLTATIESPAGVGGDVYGF